MTIDLSERIIAYAKGALTGQTPVPLRLYSFDYDAAEKTITFKAEVARELTESEAEDLAVVETEVYADCIFGDDTQIETRVEIVPEEVPLRPLHGGVVYRKDG